VTDAGGLAELNDRSATFRDLFAEQLAMARNEPGPRSAEVA
jgi:hypothetical protein